MVALRDLMLELGEGVSEIGGSFVTGELVKK